MAENRTPENVPLNPIAEDSGEYVIYGQDTPDTNHNSDSGEYTEYTPNVPNMNRTPETAWSKTRTAIILLSIFAVGAISAGITIGVMKGRKKKLSASSFQPFGPKIKLISSKIAIFFIFLKVKLNL